MYGEFLYSPNFLRIFYTFSKISLSLRLKINLSYYGKDLGILS